MVKNIIIIDDDFEDIEIMKESFEALGECQCRAFLDACEALEYLKHCPNAPHLIVIDINMPKIDGLECLVQIRLMETLRSTRIAMYSSAIPMKQTLEVFVKSQAVFFQKPSSYAEMHKIFKELI